MAETKKAEKVEACPECTRFYEHFVVKSACRCAVRAKNAAKYPVNEKAKFQGKK